MKGIKFRIGPILLPLFILAAVLAVNIALSFNRTNAASSVALGQQYLEDMDYSSAIAAFTEAIETNPGNSEARIGLAKSYSGRGDYDLAEEVIEEMVYTQNPNTEAARTMIDIYLEQHRTVEALTLVSQIIETTNEEEFYDLRNELLADLFDQPHSYAEGSDHALFMQAGKVYSMGDNNFGQLGTDRHGSINLKFRDCGFPNEAAKVYCFGNTSYVIDTAGNLWVAGENRWGQAGVGYSSLSEEYGWTQITCPGKAAEVAGTTGRLLVLLTDGSLWTAGAGGDFDLRRVTNFQTVISVGSSENTAYILTADGTLYSSSYDRPDTWQRRYTGISRFSLNGRYIDMMTNEGNLRTDMYISWPTGWQQDYYSGVTPDADVEQFIIADDLVLYTDRDGRLYRISGSGIVSEYESGKKAVNIYSCGDSAIIEYDDKTAEIWHSDAAAPEKIM